MAEGGEDRLGHADDEGDGGEQDQPHDQRGGNADATGLYAVLFRQLVGQDRDEDQVVDAEDHLHGDQRHHGRPAFGGGQEGEVGGEEFGHGGSLGGAVSGRCSQPIKLSQPCGLRVT